MWVAVGGRHPKVDLLVESLAAGVGHEGAGVGSAVGAPGDKINFPIRSRYECWQP
jgi:hypothetical protein